MMKDDQDHFLKALQPSDKVIVASPHWARKIDTVERLTKTQFVLKSGLRFNRVTGFVIGGSMWSASYLQEATIKNIEEIEYNIAHKRLVRYLSEFNWAAMELTELRKVRDLLPP